MRVKTIGIIGYGHFGEFLVELTQRFLPEVDVRVFSRRNEPDQELFFDIETVCKSDVVIICGAISEFETQLLEVLKHAPAETVIVDMATVKVHTVTLLKKHAGDRKWVATHPVFGPEGYKKQNENIEGFTVVLTDHTLSDEVFASTKNFFEGVGFKTTKTTPEEHDKYIAETLFLTHFLGQIISRAGFSRTQVDTTSFGYLMNAVESVHNDTALFFDVYRYNPYCEPLLARFDKAENEVHELLKKNKLDKNNPV